MKRPALTIEQSEALAARALNFLAGEPERLGRFLALSGIDPRTIRTVAAQPFFLSSVLDHLLTDERLLLAFAEADGCAPDAVEQARTTLAGPRP